MIQRSLRSGARLGMSLALVGAVGIWASGCGGPSPTSPASASDSSFRLLTAHHLDGAQTLHIQGASQQEPSPFADTDKDSIPDRMDSDIDGDGIPNLVDEYPYDRSKGGEDLDEDGIPDFIDFEVNSELKPNQSHESALLQHELFRRYRLYVVADDSPFTESELREIRDELKQGAFKEFTAPEKPWIIVRRASDEALLTEYGSYNPYWRSISIESDGERFTETFLHENFHRIASETRPLLQDFMKASGWSKSFTRTGDTTFTFNEPGQGSGALAQAQSFSEYELKNELETVASKLQSNEFPNDYSKMGPDEMFAECGTATALAVTHRSSPRYGSAFQNTGLFTWFVDLLKTGGKRN